MLNTKIVVEIQDVNSRLAELGLEHASLIEALRQANLYRVRTTDHHPKLYRYQIMYGETVAALRDLLVPNGWSKSDDGNYELVVNADNTIAIAVASGDDATAVATRTPSNKSPKGRHTIDAIHINRQADMFSELLETAERAKTDVSTWILLHKVSNNQILAELSKPNEIDEHGIIFSWSERIVLGAIPLDGEKVTITAPQLPDIDISISRKSA
jgi:hypothetical protein